MKKYFSRGVIDTNMACSPNAYPGWIVIPLFLGIIVTAPFVLAYEGIKKLINKFRPKPKVKQLEQQI
ncbi:Hypothetical protein HVR_LOCUS146 [uncultured virus]|nr:Hypothetical protein HVR_LOCUS146 [uncultured virus]